MSEKKHLPENPPSEDDQIINFNEDDNPTLKQHLNFSEDSIVLGSMSDFMIEFGID